MSHPWPAEIVFQVQKAVRALRANSHYEAPLVAMLEAALAISEGESGVLLSPAAGPGAEEVRIERSLNGASPEFPPALLAQVIRTGRSVAPPSLDGAVEADEPANGFGPNCGIPLDSAHGPGVLGIRLNGCPLDAVRWSALRAVADVIAEYLSRTAQDALVSAVLAAQAERTAIERKARQLRAARLGTSLDTGEFSKIVGCSEAMLSVLTDVLRLAPTGLPVLISVLFTTTHRRNALEIA